MKPESALYPLALIIPAIVLLVWVSPDASQRAYSTTPTPLPALTEEERTTILSLAESGVSSNDEWMPFIGSFDGVEMALVPAGCFTMGMLDVTGGRDGWSHEQCLDAPFWIDIYEVTNEQYGSIGCEEKSSAPDQPRNCVNWFDAKSHCESRDGRLPTEAEWEYAARGPDSLVYPWGDEFIEDNVVFGENSDGQTAPVGSKPGGVSWVGIYDMSGNVQEWTGTVYRPYPYDPGDGRENQNLTAVTRVLRGGGYDNGKYFMRPAYRTKDEPRITYRNGGFRCARDYD